MNRLQVARQLESTGIPAVQAQGIAEVIYASIQGEVATRQDLLLLRKDIQSDIQTLEISLRSDMQTLETSLRGDMQALEASLRGDIQDIRSDIQDIRSEIKSNNRLLYWMMGVMGAGISAILLLLLRILFTSITL